MALLEVRSLTKRFGGLVALQSVDLAIDDGMIAALIGPNGAGKTTFFNTLTGHYRPDQGEIRFKNRSLSGVTPDRVTHAGICRTFQNIRLFGEMSVLENVLVGMHARIGVGLAAILGRSRRFYRRESQAAARALELLALVGLQGREEEWAASLAYGDQRRLEIARALASQPELLLLDEPTAGMNPSEAEEMMALIEGLIGSHVRSILLIEHNMRVVMGVSHRVSVLDYGEKIAEGTPDEVRRDARVIEAYLGLGKQANHA